MHLTHALHSFFALDKLSYKQRKTVSDRSVTQIKVDRVKIVESMLENIIHSYTFK